MLGLLEEKVGELWAYQQMVNVEKCDRPTTLPVISVGVINLMARSQDVGNGWN